MAIDSAEKRRTASGIWFPLGPGVTPNSEQDAQWRRQAGWGYTLSVVLDTSGDPDVFRRPAESSAVLVRGVEAAEGLLRRPGEDGGVLRRP